MRTRTSARCWKARTRCSTGSSEQSLARQKASSRALRPSSSCLMRGSDSWLGVSGGRVKPHGSSFFALGRPLEHLGEAPDRVVAGEDDVGRHVGLEGLADLHHVLAEAVGVVLDALLVEVDEVGDVDDEEDAVDRLARAARAQLLAELLELLGRPAGPEDRALGLDEDRLLGHPEGAELLRQAGGERAVAALPGEVHRVQGGWTGPSRGCPRPGTRGWRRRPPGGSGRRAGPRR